MEKHLGYRPIDVRPTRGRPGTGPRHATRSAEEVPVSLFTIDACEACGRFLLVGEETSRMVIDERLFDVCRTCRARLARDGFQGAA